MDYHTVAQLKAIAKERGIRGYYNLRNAELIHTLEAARLVEQKPAYFMSRFQMIPLPFYNQHRGGHQMSRRKISKIKKNLITKGIQKIKEFGEWLLNYIPPKPKLVDKVLESFKNKI